MPTYGHVLIRYIAAAIYCVAQILLIRRAERTPEHLVMFENPAIIQWMKILVATGSFFFLLPLVSALFIDIHTVSVVTTVAGVLVSLLQGYYLFFRPEVLYGIHEHPRSSVVESSGESAALEEKEDYYTDEILKKVGEVLEDYMETAKPYLKPGYKVSDLAQETGISVHSISAFCNRRRKVNFFGYLNRYRIDYCLNKFALGEHEQKTLEALAEECGFNNRGTFIRVFKSIIGQNPTEYLSSLQKSVRL